MDLCLVLTLQDTSKTIIMKHFIQLLILLFISLLFNSCYNDIGPIEPEIEIPEEGVSFTEEIQPIFTQNCTSCHPNSGNLDLSEGIAYNQIVNKNAAAYDGKLIIPNEPENSILYKKIDHSNNYGANMPLGSTLTANEITLIKEWITEGAQNN
jgi:uncharacterized membrane protein